MATEAVRAKDSCKVAKFEGLPPKGWDKPQQPKVEAPKSKSPSFQTTVTVK